MANRVFPSVVVAIKKRISAKVKKKMIIKKTFTDGTENFYCFKDLLNDVLSSFIEQNIGNV